MARLGPPIQAGDVTFILCSCDLCNEGVRVGLADLMAADGRLGLASEGRSRAGRALVWVRIWIMAGFGGDFLLMFLLCVGSFLAFLSCLVLLACQYSFFGDHRCKSM